MSDTNFDFEFQAVTPAPQAPTSGYGALFDLGKVPLWKMPEGTHTVRLLPPNAGKSASWGADIAFHYGVTSPVTHEDHSWLCLRQMRGHRHCPACDVFFALHKQDKNHPDKQNWRASSRVLVRLIVRGLKPKPMLWLMPPSVNDDLKTDAAEAGIMRPDHPFEGVDVRIKREGEGFNTRYTFRGLTETKGPIHEDEATAKTILNSIREHPLGSLLRMLDEKQEQELKDSFEENSDGKTTKQNSPEF